MIKIKDYIFNENEINKIRFIPESTKILVDCFKNEDYIEIRKATFDDIEWNYPSKEIEYLYKSNQEFEEENNRLNKKLEELEEELEDKRKSINICLHEIDKLSSTIDKATEHLEESIYDYLKEDKNLDGSYNVMTCKTFKEKYLIPVLKILKGEE